MSDDKPFEVGEIVWSKKLGKLTTVNRRESFARLLSGIIDYMYLVTDSCDYHVSSDLVRQNGPAVAETSAKEQRALLMYELTSELGTGRFDVDSVHSMLTSDPIKWIELLAKVQREKTEEGL